MTHACKACAVHCMDFRIQKTTDNLLKSLGLSEGDFDRVSIAGGAANFEQLEKHLELSKKLHNPSQIILTIHEDCGAGAKIEDLEKTLKTTRENYPNCLSQGFVTYLNGSWKEI